MTTLTATSPLWRHVLKALAGPGRAAADCAGPVDPEAIRNAERDVIREMIWSNPEAFASELDIRDLMGMYRGGH